MEDGGVHSTCERWRMGVYSTCEGDEKCIGDVGKETGGKEITWKNYVQMHKAFLEIYQLKNVQEHSCGM